MIGFGSSVIRRSTALRFLLVCGIISSLLYIGTDILAATMLYPGYSYTCQQVSELSAIGAPTRPLWVNMGRAYGLLMVAFGMGVWLSVDRRSAGLVMVAYCDHRDILASDAPARELGFIRYASH